MQDMYSRVIGLRAISPGVLATGTKTGQVIDTAGYDSVTFIIASGASTTDAISMTPVIKSGTVTGTLTSESDSNLIGTEAAAVLTSDSGANKVRKIGYKGSNRYVQCNLVIAGSSTGSYAVIAVMGNPIKGPLAVG